VSRHTQPPSFVSVSIVVVSLQIEELLSNWRNCFACRNIKSSPNLDVSSRAYYNIGELSLCQVSYSSDLSLLRNL
jgi:hypothetical protein